MSFEIGKCAGCAELGGCRFGVSPIRTEGLSAAFADVICPPEYEGGPGVAHGGWTAAVFDDFLGQFMALNNRLTVTASLTVEYLRPVPVGLELNLVGRVLGRQRQRWHLAADLRLASTQVGLGTANGIWIERDPSHFDRHQEWLAGQGGNHALSAGVRQ